MLYIVVQAKAGTLSASNIKDRRPVTEPVTWPGQQFWPDVTAKSGSSEAEATCTSDSSQD